MHKKPNLLIKEKSPYLLQHAYNPVDWYPWGEEAFEKARAEDKPVFLSIGYSTCHWCHVMERESFEDNQVAEFLNKHFISIKVDREERPDVDSIYMSVCQALTGSGGWPLTVVMTPEKKPFFAGTYFPKESKWGRPGLLNILSKVQQEWETRREGLLQYGDKLVHLIAQPEKNGTSGQLGIDTLNTAFQQLERTFDASNGGFGSAPKFPIPHNLMFLLRYWRRTGQKKALAMVETTLAAMRKGGIYDHLGFGFARYSTDKRWLVPHFEKMLYDNALLCYVYVEAFQSTGKKEYAKTAQEIITYVLRDMTSVEGGFYSAEDADSEGVEGKFYVWTKAEILASLGEEQGSIFADFYDVSENGNFEGTNILNTTGKNSGEFASQRNLSITELEEMLAQCRDKLCSVREKRIHPFKDDKILTAWNALMIAALAKASRVMSDTSYVEAAEKALRFIQTKLIRDDGRLLARYRDGEAAHTAYLDDYAFYLWALLELYEATFNPIYLTQASDVSKAMRMLFWDEKHGGFYFYGADGETLIARPKEIYDGAMPSGNSVAAWALIRLARLTDNHSLTDMTERLFFAFSDKVPRYASGYTFLMMAVDLAVTIPRHIVISGRRDDDTTQEMLATINYHFMPDATIVLNDPEQAEMLAKVAPYASVQNAVGGHTTAYICENLACRAPIQGVERFKEALGTIIQTYKKKTR